MEQKNLHAWLETPLGQYVLRMEQDMLDQAVANLFGFNALQIGWSHLDGLRTNRIPHHMTVSASPGGTLQAEPCALPLATQSLDLVVMPHALEFTEHPHALLREVDRVMRPEGRLVIVGFNPRSLWGVRQLFTLDRRVSPWSGHFIRKTLAWFPAFTPVNRFFMVIFQRWPFFQIVLAAMIRRATVARDRFCALSSHTRNSSALCSVIWFSGQSVKYASKFRVV